MIGAQSLSKIADRFGYAWTAENDVCFSSVSIDSRRCKAGDLFVALHGDNFDGHTFLPAVELSGVCAAVVDHAVSSVSLPQLVVDNTVLALGNLALVNREEFKKPVIALTGSCGKTSVKEMLRTILLQCGDVHATSGNLNNHIGLPLTVLALEAKHEYAIFEIGASGPGEVLALTKIAVPDVVLVNNVHPAHVAGFGSVENIAQAKGEIYEALKGGGVAVINLDDRFAPEWRVRAGQSRQITFAIEDVDADVRAMDIELDEQGCAQFLLSTPVGSATVKMKLPGLHNVRNALAAAACAGAVGASVDQIAKGLGLAQSVAGRMTLVSGVAGSQLIDDTYNANPGSVNAAIDVLSALTGKHGVLVLGDMLELGDESAALHYAVGQYAREKGISHLFTIGKDSCNASNAFGAGSHHAESQQEIVDACKALAAPQVVFLVKGSRGSAMEHVVDALRNKQEDVR